MHCNLKPPIAPSYQIAAIDQSAAKVCHTGEWVILPVYSQRWLDRTTPHLGRTRAPPLELSDHLYISDSLLYFVTRVCKTRLGSRNWDRISHFFTHWENTGRIAGDSLHFLSALKIGERWGVFQKVRTLNGSCYCLSNMLLTVSQCCRKCCAMFQITRLTCSDSTWAATTNFTFHKFVIKI